MTDLYVMQNECGLIKIGRSRDVERRRKSLETTEACRIVLVATIPGGGHLEEQTHNDLDRFRLIGEWFDGTTLARSAIEAKLGSGVITGWPFDLACQGVVDDWLEKVEGRRFLQRSIRELSRLIRHMMSVPEERRNDPGGYFDTHIWTILNTISPDRDARIVADRGSDGNAVLRVLGGANSGDLLPPYTTDVAAALLVWPEDQQALAWADSPWECCVAGLTARKSSTALIIQALLDSEDTDF